jgi:hypothetical protein
MLAIRLFRRVTLQSPIFKKAYLFCIKLDDGQQLVKFEPRVFSRHFTERISHGVAKQVLTWGPRTRWSLGSGFEAIPSGCGPPQICCPQD